MKFDIRNTLIENNYTGFLADGSATGEVRGEVRGVIADSRVAGNTANGIQANSNGRKVVVMVSDTTVQGKNAGLVASGAGSTILADDSQVTGNSYGLYVAGGQLLSYGNNNVNQNTTSDGAFTGTVAEK